MDFSEVKTPLTLKQVDSLYWLGRYSERVLSSLRVLMHVYDSELDTTFDYADYCEKLGIYNAFSSLADFCRRYAFDRSYQSSLLCGAEAANGNAMMLRDIIGSDCLSYVELSLGAMREAAASEAPVLLFQRAVDCIMAFRGAVADTVQDRNALNIIRTGFGVERLDFYLRLAIHERTVLFESRRLTEAISCTDVACDSLQLAKITGSLCELDDFADRADKMILLQLIDSLFSGS
ncbi:MAG: alpha-E domain-containing protein [Treponema sp.]|nr:alpha-E domain-containing protein [Treponema sp.]